MARWETVEAAKSKPVLGENYEEILQKDLQNG